MLLQPHFNHCVLFGTSQYKQDVTLIDSSQRRAIKMVNDLEGKLYEGGVAKAILFVQPREVETDRKSQGGLQLSHKGSRGAGTEFSLT